MLCRQINFNISIPYRSHFLCIPFKYLRLLGHIYIFDCGQKLLQLRLRIQIIAPNVRCDIDILSVAGMEVDHLATDLICILQILDIASHLLLVHRHIIVL